MSPTPKTSAPKTAAAAKPVVAPAGTPNPKTVTLPLTPELQAAYHDLYNQYEAGIESITDAGLLQSLNDSQDAVGDVLLQNSQYQINQNTAAFKALQTQIKSTNTDLKALSKQIAAIAGKIAVAGTILAGINKVLSLAGV